MTSFKCCLPILLSSNLGDGIFEDLRLNISIKSYQNRIRRTFLEVVYLEYALCRRSSSGNPRKQKATSAKLCELYDSLAKALE